MTKIADAIKAVKVATTRERVREVLKVCTAREMRIVYLETTKVPFIATPSWLTDMEIADRLTTMLMEYKEHGIRSVG